ncbi:hypothetical protein SUNI508_10196 [Seiridium unicorne]|uniref:Uncharacterized protein n=1 Tax=Seiridium unicorne TaxID=138068 RepID=A0ABR2UM50_9PEZI
MFALLVITPGIVATTYILLLALLRATQDTTEPPSVNDAIPFITPVWKMFFEERIRDNTNPARDQYNMPIHTLRLPGSRVYVINSPTLLKAAQSQLRALSSTALQCDIAAKIPIWRGYTLRFQNVAKPASIYSEAVVIFERLGPT